MAVASMTAVPQNCKPVGHNLSSNILWGGLRAGIVLVKHSKLTMKWKSKVFLGGPGTQRITFLAF